METSVIVIVLNKTKWRKPRPAMDKITQDMKYRYSLVNYALSEGVSKASRKYNKGRSYIYFWIKRFDGEISSLASQSRRPKHHPQEHRQDEIDLIRRYWSRNRELGLFELWFKLRKQGYTRHYVVFIGSCAGKAWEGKNGQEKQVQAQALRTDALCRAKSASGCKSSTQRMHPGQKLEALLPIHSYR